MMQSFVPMNELESMIVLAKNGQLPVSDLMRKFVVSDIVLPSGAEVLADGAGFEPLLFSKEKVQMVACFTDKNRIGEYAKMTPYLLVMTGKDFLRGIPNGYGVVVNPGQGVGFDISPDGVSKVLGDFSR